MLAVVSIVVIYIICYLVIAYSSLHLANEFINHETIFGNIGDPGATILLVVCQLFIAAAVIWSLISLISLARNRER